MTDVVELLRCASINCDNVHKVGAFMVGIVKDQIETAIEMIEAEEDILDDMLKACEDALEYVQATSKVQEMDDLEDWPWEMMGQLQGVIAKARRAT